MRSMLSRLGVALMAAAIFATVPVSIDLDRPAGGAGSGQLVRLHSPSTALADDDEIEIDDMEKVKRGEKDIMFRADVKKSGLVCRLKIKYADGDVDTVGQDESDKKGICAISFDVPERRSVVGDATAKLRVETKRGADRGKASRNFLVRDRRGG
jgi:hypothetical protein